MRSGFIQRRGSVLRWYSAIGPQAGHAIVEWRRYISSIFQTRLRGTINFLRETLSA
jgi:hypothetical protein